MKNGFYFTLIALLVLKIFKILSRLFWSCRKRLDKKAQVNFKNYDVIDWEKINTTHSLPNISRSKGNETMKFSQLIENNMKNSFLEKAIHKM